MARRQPGGKDIRGGSPTSSTSTSPTLDRDTSRKPDEGPREARGLGGAGFGVVDILRILAGGILLSFALSWVVTGESVLWGWRPWFTRLGDVQAYMRGPLRLTDEQLKAFDGSDPEKPIYVGLNGSIYDVSVNRHTYGPGGSYHFFAGRDAARAFITGCFQEDLTPDMRGVEEMYIPRSLDTVTGPEKPVEKDGKPPLSKAEIKIKREQATRKAKKQIKDTIDGWHKMYRGEKDNKGYFYVGQIEREPGWLEKLPKRKLCDAAEKSRPEELEEEQQQQ